MVYAAYYICVKVFKILNFKVFSTISKRNLWKCSSSLTQRMWFAIVISVFLIWIAWWTFGCGNWGSVCVKFIWSLTLFTFDSCGKRAELRLQGRYWAMNRQVLRQDYRDDVYYSPAPFVSWRTRIYAYGASIQTKTADTHCWSKLTASGHLQRAYVASYLRKKNIDV